MSETNKYKPPKETGGDHVHAVARSGLGAIPFGGTAAIEIFNKIITPPIESRRDEWRQLVGERLQKLDAEGKIDLEELAADEEFATIILQATQTAIRNHQQQKLIALSNAVVNSAMGINIKEDVRLILIRYVDELVPSHLTLLRLFSDNESKLANVKSYEQLYQELKKLDVDSTNRDELKLLCGDLINRGLLRISQQLEDYEDIYHGPGRLLLEGDDDRPSLIVTEFGRNLLEFVKTKEAKTA